MKTFLSFQSSAFGPESMNKYTLLVQGGQEKLAAAPKEQDFPSLAASKLPSESSTPAGTAWTRPPSQLQGVLSSLVLGIDLLCLQ